MTSFTPVIYLFIKYKEFHFFKYFFFLKYIFRFLQFAQKYLVDLIPKRKFFFLISEHIVFDKEYKMIVKIFTWYM
jgi:hypothetical protein